MNTWLVLRSICSVDSSSASIVPPSSAHRVRNGYWPCSLCTGGRSRGSRGRPPVARHLRPARGRQPALVALATPGPTRGEPRRMPRPVDRPCVGGRGRRPASRAGGMGVRPQCWVSLRPGDASLFFDDLLPGWYDDWVTTERGTTRSVTLELPRSHHLCATAPGCVGRRPRCRAPTRGRRPTARAEPTSPHQRVSSIWFRRTIGTPTRCLSNAVTRSNRV